MKQYYVLVLKTTSSPRGKLNKLVMRGANIKTILCAFMRVAGVTWLAWSSSQRKGL